MFRNGSLRSWTWTIRRMHAYPMRGSSPEPADLRPAAQTLATCGAIAVPALVAYNLPPSATFFNQALALLGWGAWLLVVAVALRGPPSPWSSGLKALVKAFIVSGEYRDRFRQ